jgi:ABC-type transporter MlaC component
MTIASVCTHEETQQIINIVTQHLNDEYSGAEYFDILLSSSPEIDKSDENNLTVRLQAEVCWSHWKVYVIRKFEVHLDKQDGEWDIVNVSWEDISEEPISKEEEEEDDRHD